MIFKGHFYEFYELNLYNYLMSWDSGDDIDKENCIMHNHIIESILMLYSMIIWVTNQWFMGLKKTMFIIINWCQLIIMIFIKNIKNCGIKIMKISQLMSLLHGWWRMVIFILLIEMRNIASGNYNVITTRQNVYVKYLKWLRVKRIKMRKKFEIQTKSFCLKKSVWSFQLKCEYLCSPLDSPLSTISTYESKD